MRKLLTSLIFLLWWCLPLAAQSAINPLTPLSSCQLTASSTAALISTCTQATFTATGSGTTLTVSGLTNGFIHPGATISGTGVPVGTTIVAQLTSTAANGVLGSIGTYQTSGATTSNGATITSSGIPQGTNLVVISVDTANIRWRDDGGAPTTAIGIQIVAASVPYVYSGTPSQLQVIAVSGSPVVNMAFYKSP